jgi:hypothetical protein
MKKSLLAFVGICSISLSHAQNDLFISMYVAGSANNKAIELYNPTSNSIVLTGVYRLTQFDNGSTSPTFSANLKGTILPNSTFVLANGQVTNDSVIPPNGGANYVSPRCDTALQNRANQLDTAHFNGFSYFNGDDALVLEKLSNGTWQYVDIFACIGEYPTAATGNHYGWWSVAPYNNAPISKAWTKYHSMVRKSSIHKGVLVNPAPGTWNPSIEWDTLKNNSYPTGHHSMDHCSASYSIAPDPNHQGNYIVTNNAWGTGTIHYDWNWGDGTPHDTTPTPSHTYASPALTNICLTITDATGCTSSQCDTLTVARIPYWTAGTHTTVSVIFPGLATDIPAHETDTQLRIYPNPNNGSFTILSDNTTSEIEFTNILGKQIWKKTLNQSFTEVDLQGISPGIYFYRIWSQEKRVITGKVIIQ